MRKQGLLASVVMPMPSSLPGGGILLEGSAPTIGEQGGEFSRHGRAARLQGEQPVSPAHDDQPGALDLVDGVAGNQHAGQIERPQQCPGDIVAALGDRHPANHGACHRKRTRPRRVQRRSVGSTVERAAQRLAIDRQDTRPAGSECFEELPGAGRERRRIEQVEQPRECVAAGNSPIQPPRRMRRKQAAGYLGVSEGFLEKAACRGDGPAYLRLSARLVLYERAELDRWATARQVTSSAEAANLAQSMKAA